MPQATTTASLASPTVEVPLTDEKWELDTTVTRSPVPIIEACDTSDGCAKTCASSCTSS